MDARRTTLPRQGSAAWIGHRLFVVVTAAALLVLALANLRSRAAWHEAEDGVLWTETAEGVVARELAPGGAAYVTVHGDGTWAAMGPKVPLYNYLMNARDSIAEERITESFFARPMPRARLSLTWSKGEIYNVNMFHSFDYIRSVWGRFFTRVEILRQREDPQDVVILRP